MLEQAIAKVNTTNELITLTRRSGVVDLVELGRWLGRHLPLPSNPARLAEMMVTDGLLTPFQAKRLLLGRWRNLLIGGKYRVLQPLVATAFGRYFLCEHTLIRHRVLLKIFNGVDPSNEVAIKHLLREAKALMMLKHPHIVRALDVDHIDRLYYIVLEYTEGPTLEQLLIDNGPLPVGTAANLGVQILRGLDYAHRMGWVHREIQPANLLLDRDGTVRILNMGLARMLNGPGGDSGRLLSGPIKFPRLEYFAPEQLSDPPQFDERSDLYSLGVTMYYLLTSCNPFQTTADSANLDRILSGIHTPLRQHRNDIPEKLAQAIARLMHVNPANRFINAAEVLAALEPFADRQPDLTKLKLDLPAKPTTANDDDDAKELDTPEVKLHPATTPVPRSGHSILHSGLDFDGPLPAGPPFHRVLWVSLVAFGSIAVISWLVHRLQG